MPEILAKITRVLAAVLLTSCLASAAATEGPVAVSPGSASTPTLVEGRCPAFSWGAVPGARSYELVVFRLGEEEEEAEAVLRESLAGSASSWTPSLDRCLERGGEYAWSVRAVGERAESGWSVPSFFQVAPGPTPLELEEALSIVRRAMEEKAAGRSAISAAAGEPPSSPGSGGRRAPSARGAPAVPWSLLVAPGDSRLQVNGSPVVTMATLAGALCNFHGVRYLDPGNGTVLDCNTGLIWLKDASCADLAGTNLDGQGSWATAQTAAAALASGTCGLTDGSSAGDWRLPTISEFCSAGAIQQVCPATDAPESLIDVSVSGFPKVANAKGDGKWSEGDAFVGVQGAEYWSATQHSSGYAWYAHLLTGEVYYGPKTSPYFVWPVRGGP